MSLANFIPEVWSQQLLVNLQKVHIFGQGAIINRDYQGEIRAFGDTVKINAIGPISVGTYTRDTDIDDPEALTDAQAELKIDQAKYFNFQVDDLDQAQQKPKVMAAAMTDASYYLRDAADSFIADLYTDASASNAIGNNTTPHTVVAGTPGVGEYNIFDELVDLRVKLNKAKIPTGGRFVIAGPEILAVMLKDERFTKANVAGSADTLRSGQIGRVLGFDVYESPNCPVVAGSKYKVIAGHPMAWSFAEQIVKVEPYRMEKRFADAVKGLHVYGAKVVRPAALAVLTATVS